VGDVPPEAATVIERVAGERGAELIRAGDGVELSVLPPDAVSGNVFRLCTPAADYGTIRLALHGAHQIGNAIAAVRLLEAIHVRGLPITQSAVVGGLEQVRWPGRLERRLLTGGRELILDAAHNPAGAAALTSYLRSAAGTPPVLVFAAMRDKDAKGMLDVLLPAVGRVIVTKASNSRSADPHALAADARALAPGTPVEIVPSPIAALEAAWTHSPRVVVAGSIFLLGDIMKEIGA
jgi:dihydrofolate synthase/folylpolyglutamate synthase